MNDPRSAIDFEYKNQTMIAPSIVLVNPKFPHNVGAAVRAAACFGISQVWFTGDRITQALDGLKRLPREERMKGYRSVDLINHPRPLNLVTRETIVAVEFKPGSQILCAFSHPIDAVYVFGPEDGSLDKGMCSFCHLFVVIPSRFCLNLAAAVNVVMYDRVSWLWEQGLDKLPEREQ